MVVEVEVEVEGGGWARRAAWLGVLLRSSGRGDPPSAGFRGTVSHWAPGSGQAEEEEASCHLPRFPFPRFLRRWKHPQHLDF
ncbi:hypothetical protein ACOMHN_047014 [Nucella lapillus]